MKQEDKDLLLKDICARLPYHPFFIGNKHDIMPLYNVNTYAGIIDCIPAEKIEDCRLYLRPMSSMTEEELNEYENFITNEKDDQIRFCNELVFYNSHHFDYRGLIEKGLALEAPVDMY